MTRLRTTLICAVLATSWACSQRPRQPAAPAPLVPSCYSVAFGPWVGPVGLLELSSAPRVVGLTRTPAAPAPLGQPSTGQVRGALTPRRWLAQLLDGPSFGSLAPAVPPVWWPIGSTASFVVSIADSTHGLEIQINESDSGLAGIAVAGTSAIVRDSSGTYTQIAARSPVTARPVPCP